jgi:iron(III) transport system ATP-binding protein
MTVAKNIAYGLPRGVSRERVQALVRLVGLEALEGRMPHELSGGQQQRVALARTLATEPEVLLLDEPFSNLDARLRVQVREEVRRIIQETGTTAVFVTHDQEEAFVMADRIIVMRSGRAEQMGTAVDLYLRPATRYVAGFVGLANFLPARMQGESLACDLGPLQPDAGGRGVLEVMLRPEDILLGEGPVEVEVVGREFHGAFVLHTIRFASGREAIIRRPAAGVLEVGTRIGASMRPNSAVLFEVSPDDTPPPTEPS